MASDVTTMLNDSETTSPCTGTERIEKVDAASEASTEIVSASINSLPKFVLQVPSSWEKQLQSADERQEQLSHLQWNLVREQIGAHAQEIGALQQELHALRLDWSQHGLHQEDHGRRMREMQLQVQQDLSSAAAHRRDLEAHIGLSLNAIADEAQASLRSLQTDMKDRSEALERATRNFSVSDDRIGKAFQQLSELNLVLDEEKKQRGVCFDGLGQDLRALRISQDDAAAKRAAHDVQTVAEAHILSTKFDELGNMEASLRQAIQDVSSQVCQEERSRILACKLCQQEMEERHAGTATAMAKESQDSKIDISLMRDQLEVLANSTGQREDVVAQYEELDRKMSNWVLVWEADVQRVTSGMLGDMREQMEERFFEQKTRSESVESMVEDLVCSRFKEETATLVQNLSTLEGALQKEFAEVQGSRALAETTWRLELEDSKQVQNQRLESVIADQNLANLELTSGLEALTNHLTKVPDDLPERLADISTEYGTRLSALEGRDRGKAVASVDRENAKENLWEHLANVVTEQDVRLGTLEMQDGAVRAKLKEDRDELLVCCQALEAKLAAESGDYKESVGQIRKKLKECLTRIDNLKRTVEEQAAKSGSQKEDMQELIVGACAQELSNIQQLLAKEAERRIENHTALQGQFDNEAASREDQGERIRVYLEKERTAREAEYAILQERMDGLESGFDGSAKTHEAPAKNVVGSSPFFGEAAVGPPVWEASVEPDKIRERDVNADDPLGCKDGRLGATLRQAVEIQACMHRPTSSQTPSLSGSLNAPLRVVSPAPSPIGSTQEAQLSSERVAASPTPSLSGSATFVIAAAQQPPTSPFTPARRLMPSNVVRTMPIAVTSHPQSVALGRKSTPIFCMVPYKSQNLVDVASASIANVSPKVRSMTAESWRTASPLHATR